MRDGGPVDVRFEGGDWKMADGALVAGGEGRLVRGGRRVGPGDFTIEAQLSITGLAKSAASFVIGDSHFGFEGSRGEMFTHGPVFGTADLGEPVVGDGRPFAFLVRRAGEVLSVAIDGREVCRVAVSPEAVFPVGFRPHRSTMAITSFVARGGLGKKLPDPLPMADIFTSGEGGYHSYRIPAVVVTGDGTLLAFCEGRREGRGDAGDIDVIVRRSTDLGESWSDPIVVWDDGGNTCGNPCPVVDRDTGTIWLLLTWNLGSDHESEIMKGTSEEVRHVFVTRSDDDGRSWRAPARISGTTRRPHWRWYATGPGNGIQLEHGEHQGRLLVPANHSDHSDPDRHPYRSHVIWSDDHGATWELGGIHEDRTNESAVVERSDGSVIQLMRSYHGKGLRAVAASVDGGATWGPVTLHEDLVTPVCQASAIRVPGTAREGGPDAILFSSPLGSERARMTVWLSEDDGETWPIRREVHGGAAAYSNLVALPDGRIGLLFEKDGYRSIAFTTFTLDWIRAGE